MVVVCFICAKRREKKSSQRSYHLFPKGDGRILWFQQLGITVINWKPYIYLCSDHFDEDSFIEQPQGRRVLRKGALPIKVVSGSGTETEISSISSSPTSSSSDSVMSGIGEASNSNEIQSELTESHAFSTIFVNCDNVVSVKEEIEIVEPSLKRIKIEEIDEMPNGLLVEQRPPSPSTSATISNASDTEEFILTVEEIQEQIVEEREPVRITAPRKRLPYAQPRYPGDITIDQFHAPRTAERCWEVARKTIDSQRKKIKTLQQQTRRLKSKVQSLELLNQHLKNKVANCPKCSVKSYVGD